MGVHGHKQSENLKVFSTNGRTNTGGTGRVGARDTIASETNSTY